MCESVRLCVCSCVRACVCVCCIYTCHSPRLMFLCIISGDGMLIEDNVIEKFVGDGIRVASNDVTIRRNIVRSCLAVDADHRDLIQVKIST